MAVTGALGSVGASRKRHRSYTAMALLRRAKEKTMSTEEPHTAWYCKACGTQTCQLTTKIREREVDDTQAVEAPIIPASQRPNPTLRTWVTKSGERIAVKDMTDSHLVNTVRLLRRWGTVAKEAAWWQINVYLDSDPPDGAYDCASMEAKNLDRMSIDEFVTARVVTFKTMLLEAKRRGVEVDAA